jgi:predicted CxxxxCH...CXXCH cytochrome family protein
MGFVRRQRAALVAAAALLTALVTCEQVRHSPQLVGDDRCTRCHGGAAGSAAPPPAVAGESATTSPAVGAHASHLRDAAIRHALGCGACHVVPASPSDPGHVDASPAEVRFGELATARGARPEWDRERGVCSGVYCHGATLTGGTVRTPAWTRVDGTQRTCASCHGAPPPSGGHGPTEHRGSCGDCHGPGYTATSVDAALHVNGARDVGGPGTRIGSWDPSTGTCEPRCHGSASWYGDGGAGPSR